MQTDAPLEGADWINVGDFGNPRIARLASDRLKNFGVPNRLWAPEWTKVSSIWVSPDDADKARQFLYQMPVDDEALEREATAVPAPEALIPPTAIAVKGVAILADIFTGVTCLIALGGGAMAIVILLHILGPCVTTVLWELPSPDGRLKASVMQQQCSPESVTGGVSIVPTTSAIRSKTQPNLLSNAPHPHGLSVSWEGPRRLVIRYPAGDALTLRNTLYTSPIGAIQIRLQPVTPVTPDP